VTVASKYLRRDPTEVPPWAETCGQIRPLIEAAKLHYHEHTDEVY